uniref:Uncharacterized protein n=1 Tax=Aegilops tauschii subsp. strangulata TaxID=200361 RepID=A0A453CMS2_AEGTS
LGGGGGGVRRHNPPFLLNKPAELRRNLVGTVDFTVPSGGSRLGEELWTSKTAHHFVGCSDATKEFADAKAVTEPNRYLMIATSGGLNQQRTGVSKNERAAILVAGLSHRIIVFLLGPTV